MSLAVALGYDWLYDALSEDDRRTIRDALARSGLAAGMRGGWWARAGNNWGQVCRAGMIAAALVLADDESLRRDCERMVRESVAALPVSMKAMAPDGCYPEGPGYWHYGVSFNVYAIAMLESACGTDFGLSSLPGFWKTAEYPNLVTGPTGLTMGYSDCGTGRGAMGVLWWYAQKLKRPDLPTEKEVGAWKASLSAERADRMAATELLWMDDREPEAFPWRAPSVWAPQGVVQIATLRSGGGSGDSFVGLKGGKPKTNHGHMDGGNFVFDMGGERWAWELSSENYNRIEQMKTVTLWSMNQESSRWSLLRLNTFGHNVPRIDGAQQCVTGCAYVVSAEGGPSPSAVMDLTTLYPAAKKVTRRAILMEDGRKFAVTDTFEGLRPGAEIVWQFVTRAKGEPNGLALLLSQEGKSLRVIRRGTNASEWSFAPAEGPKPLNAPNKGFSIASFVVRADASGHAEARVGFALGD